MCANVPKYIFIVEINAVTLFSAAHLDSNKSGWTTHGEILQYRNEISCKN